jgi:hypothetical protein
MVGEVRPRAEDVVADLLREGTPLREACGLADELVEGVGVVLEVLAVLLLSLRPLARGVAVRIDRLGRIPIFPSHREADVND